MERCIAERPLGPVAKVAEERPSTRRRIDLQEAASNEGDVRFQPDSSPGIDNQHVSWDADVVRRLGFRSHLPGVGHSRSLIHSRMLTRRLPGVFGNQVGRHACRRYPLAARLSL
jgi:hypothetical protein